MAAKSGHNNRSIQGAAYLVESLRVIYFHTDQDDPTHKCMLRPGLESDSDRNSGESV